MDLFRSANSSPEQIRAIKTWVSEVFRLVEDDTVMVTELRCSEPGCPPLETVIAVLSSSGSRHFKLHKSAAEIARADIDELCLR